MAADKRLKTVHQADLTESRVNDDFVYWLKTWGSNILIGVLVLAAAGMGYQWWQQRKEKERDDAWAELSGTALPEALIEVAQKHQGKDAVSIFAELTAADRYSDAILRGKRFDRDATAADAAITPELREEWMKEADRLYAHVAEATANPKSMGTRMFNVSALFGRAGLAEDRGDLKSAEEYLQQVREVVKGTDQAPLAELAAKRLETLGQLATQVVFASRPAAPAIPSIPAVPTTLPNQPTATPPLLQNPGDTGGLIQLPDGSYSQRLPGATVTLKPVPLEGDAPAVDDPNSSGGTAEGQPTPGSTVTTPTKVPRGAKNAVPSKKPATTPPATQPASPPATPPTTPPAAPKTP